MIHKFRSRKDTSEYLKTKGIDTSDWTEVQWLKLNSGQAEIHMMALAEAMWDALNESTPKELKAGEWHIPFIDLYTRNCVDSFLGTDEPKKSMSQQEIDLYNITLIKIATARCARISYTVVGEEGKKPNYENDINLHDRLAASGHWSPFEHCAKAMSEYEHHQYGIAVPSKPGIGEPLRHLGWNGNFRGFLQYRKTFNNENII